MTRALLLARCPAKINLSLRVLGRRPDGHHELETVFQAIDLWDTLEVRPGSGLSVTSDDPSLPLDETNLVLRAALAFRERHGGGDLGAAFHLRKQIPVGGGLGGGSTDAAGALRLLTRFWEVPVPEEGRLAHAGAQGRDRYRLASENPAKLPLVRRLVSAHRDEQVLVMGQYLRQVRAIAEELGVPLLTGSTPNRERQELYSAFRQGRVRTLVLSKVANLAVDLPSAGVAIQVSGRTDGFAEACPFIVALGQPIGWTRLGTRRTAIVDVDPSFVPLGVVVVDCPDNDVIVAIAVHISRSAR